MPLILIDPPEDLKNIVAPRVLAMGITVYHAKKKEELENFLNKGSSHILIRVNQVTNPWLTTLSQIREKKTQKNYKFIVLSNKNDRDFIQALLLLNISAFLPESSNPEIIYGKLQNILKENSEHEKREHHRFKPKDSDQMSFHFSIPNTTHELSGRVLNISITGVAIECNDQKIFSLLKNGQMISRAQITIRGRLAITGLKILVLQGNVVGAIFTHYTEFFSHLLGNYILECVSSK